MTSSCLWIQSPLGAWQWLSSSVGYMRLPMPDYQNKPRNIFSLHRMHVEVRWWGGEQRKSMSLHWRHNDHDGASNHHPHGCLLNRLFRRKSKKTSKLRVTGLCAENSPGPVNSRHKWPVTRKMFPFDDVIMLKWSPLLAPSIAVFRVWLCQRKWVDKRISFNNLLLIMC